MKKWGFLLFVVLSMVVLASCTTYTASGAYSNDSYLAGRAYDVVGIVTTSTKIVYSGKNINKGVKAVLIKAAKKQYGEDIGDVIDIKAVNRLTYWFFWTTGRVDFEGVAIRFTDGESSVADTVD